MQSSVPTLLIFTDLDGTLLDHASYSASPADKFISRLNALSFIHVIPVTSKTHAELLMLQRIVPFSRTICATENGSVIRYQVATETKTDGGSCNIDSRLNYREIRNAILKLPSSIQENIKGFGDMTVQEVADATGLAFEDAQRAKDREATEPFLWFGSDTDFATLQAMMAAQSIDIQRGGRFYHLTGKATKSDAIKEIISSFKHTEPTVPVISIALGDGPNDLAMIEAADHGVIIPNPHGVTITSDQPNVRVAPFAGPQGWVAAVTKIFEELGIQHA